MGKTAAGLIGILLALLILLPAALFGGKHAWAMPLALGLIVLVTLVIRHYPTARKLSPASWWLLLFLVWLGLSTAIFSVRPYASAMALIPVVAGALIFLLLQSFPPDQKTLKIFSRSLLGGATVIILFGFYVYLSPRFPSLRMGGLFRQHNAWAGFLITLLPLSLASAVFEKKARLIWGLAAILITSTLILTFSRGGLIAASVALIFFFLLLWRQNQHWQGESLPAGKVSPYWQGLTLTIAILTAGALLAFGFYSVKTANFTTVGIAAADSPYAGERPEEGETGVNARFQYWQTALKIFSEQPIAGFGLDTFGQEYRRIQNDPRFYSLDPHNLFLKLLAESGLVGTILFIGFLISLLWPRLKELWQKPSSPTKVALAAGLLGLLAHYGVDLDLTFPAHYLIFFTLAGLLATSPEKTADEPTASQKINRAFQSILLVGGLVLFLLVALRYTAHHFFERAKLTYLAEENGDWESFEKLLAKSEQFNPFDPTRALITAEFYLDNNELERAFSFAQKAATVQPRDADTLFLLGKILAQLEQNQAAEEQFRLAVKYQPARDLEPYVYLVNTLIDTGQTEKARAVAMKGLAMFPEELFTSSLWVHYNKATIRFQRELLAKYLEL